MAGPKLIRAFARAYPEAVFVEIGANDGVRHDHLRPHVLAGGWRGVMVEPVPYVFEHLRHNYAGMEGVILENAAIADHDGRIPFFHLPPVADPESEGLPDWYDALGSFSLDAVLAHADTIPDLERRLVSTEVRCLTLASLCQRHRVQHIDVLVTDTEGHDAEILDQLELRGARPRLIVYEHYHLPPEERDACRRRLERAGYLTMEEHFDTFCLDPVPDDELVRLWRGLTPAFAGVSAADEHPR
jgi:FkbM family methyltransferase